MFGFGRKRDSREAERSQERAEQAALAKVKAAARKGSGRHTATLPDGGEAYAYKMGGGRIAYGINGPDGLCRFRSTTN